LYRYIVCIDKLFVLINCVHRYIDCWR